MDNLHEQYIEELLYGNVALTPREMAAKNEILKLRGKSPQPERPAGGEEDAEDKKGKFKK